jgi:hypothetical protein
LRAIAVNSSPQDQCLPQLPIITAQQVHEGLLFGLALGQPLDELERQLLRRHSAFDRSRCCPIAASRRVSNRRTAW